MSWILASVHIQNIRLLAIELTGGRELVALNNGRTILQIAVCHPVTTVCIKPAIEQGTIVIHDLTILVPTQDNVPE